MMNAENPKVCVLCGAPFSEFGNNPWPIALLDDGQCCDECDRTRVLPARLAGLTAQSEQLMKSAEKAADAFMTAKYPDPTSLETWTEFDDPLSEHLRRAHFLGFLAGVASGLSSEGTFAER